MEAGRPMASAGAQLGSQPRAGSNEPPAYVEGSGTSARHGASGPARPEQGGEQRPERLGSSPPSAAQARLAIPRSPSRGQQGRERGLPEGPSRQVTMPRKDEWGRRRQREVTREGTKAALLTAVSLPVASFSPGALIQHHPWAGGPVAGEWRPPGGFRSSLLEP